MSSRLGGNELLPSESSIRLPASIPRCLERVLLSAALREDKRNPGSLGLAPAAEVEDGVAEGGFARAEGGGADSAGDEGEVNRFEEKVGRDDTDDDADDEADADADAEVEVGAEGPASACQ